MLHGAPLSIVSDRNARFTTQFWQSLQKGLGIDCLMSTTIQPQTDGQFERKIQILEDMLRASVLDWHGSWENFLPLVEFANNNAISRVWA